MAKSGTKKARPPIRVQNLTREQTLVTAGWAADNHWTRLRGLLGHEPLSQGEGLLIVPSNSIHMLFMGFPIDVLYVDSALKVIGLHHTLRPWSLFPPTQWSDYLALNHARYDWEAILEQYGVDTLLLERERQQRQLLAGNVATRTSKR